jgi:phosphoinositide-3-kinase regulatory subunit 4
MDQSSFVKTSFLKNILKLCVFFGKKKSNDFVLPMIITFLNSKEWLLRYTFFEKITDVAIYVGPNSLKEFILPCILQGIIINNL